MLDALALEPDGIVRMSWLLVDVLVFAGAVAKLHVELCQMSSEGRYYFKMRGAGFIEKFASLTFSVGLIAAFCSRFGFLGDFVASHEASVLTITALMRWSYMLYFLLGNRHTGLLFGCHSCRR